MSIISVTIITNRFKKKVVEVVVVVVVAVVAVAGERRVYMF